MILDRNLTLGMAVSNEMKLSLFTIGLHGSGIACSCEQVEGAEWITWSTVEPYTAISFILSFFRAENKRWTEGVQLFLLGREQ